jgi:quercetin dioxygenase-like cupin family protein
MITTEGYKRPDIVQQAKDVVEMVLSGKPAKKIEFTVDNFLEWKGMAGLSNGNVRMMTMGRVSDRIILQVYFPKDSEVKMHYHKEEQEIITVLVGEINYKITTLDNEILNIGTLKRFEQLEIEPGDKHLIFTTNQKAFIMVDLFKQ